MTNRPTPEQNLAAILRSPTYLRAYEDIALLHRVELRPVRLQLELLKPEMILQENEIESMVVLFGSSRIASKEQAERLLADSQRVARERPDDPVAARDVAVARSLLKKCRYYDEARRFASQVSQTCQSGGRLHYVICTGGGPGIMEAGNRGAWDIGAKTVGMNITLPHEQAPNPYITPDLCFQFHYFAIRKMHLLLRAKAAVFFPGGLGTLDELFETLTLVQTVKMKPLPIVLVGEDFWRRVVDWDYLAEEGTISPHDLDLFHICDSAEEAWEFICHYHKTPELLPGAKVEELIGASPHPPMVATSSGERPEPQVAPDAAAAKPRPEVTQEVMGRRGRAKPPPPEA
jgi:uncharacterized protein (TIGR00730 family)